MPSDSNRLGFGRRYYRGAVVWTMTHELADAHADGAAAELRGAVIMPEGSPPAVVGKGITGSVAKMAALLAHLPAGPVTFSAVVYEDGRGTIVRTHPDGSAVTHLSRPQGSPAPLPSPPPSPAWVQLLAAGAAALAATKAARGKGKP